MNDPSLDTDKKKKFEHVLKVQEYASSIGLQPTDSFRTYVELDRDAVAYNIKAVKSDSFEMQRWWFPVVGSVPYLGFFDRTSAEKQAKNFRADDWDVAISTVAGYSTLGWFADPLMSPQLKFPEYYLTELVIHESVHSTLWLTGSVSFNESFATYYAQEATAQYYESTDPAFADRYRLHLNEEKQYISLIRQYAGELNNIYSNTDLSKSEKIVLKTRKIENMKADLKVRQNNWKSLNIKKAVEKDWNNAHFAGMLTYYSGDEVFGKFMEKCNRNLQCFLEKARTVSENDIIQIENQVRNSP
jgi:predicted aminopeptidase